MTEPYLLARGAPDDNHDKVSEIEYHEKVFLATITNGNELKSNS